MTPAAAAIAHHTLGDLIAVVYGAFIAEGYDDETASVATAAVLNDLLTRAERDEDDPDA